MARSGRLGLSRDSFRDISGNLVPLGILLFFAAWFAFEMPWGWNPFAILVVYGLLTGLGLTLLAVTYAVALEFQAIDPDR